MRILWVSNHTPFLVDFGGGQRSNLIYRTLRGIAEIDVLLLVPGIRKGRTFEELYGKPDGLMEVVHPKTRGQRLPWRLLYRLAPELIDRIARNIGRRWLDYAPDPGVVSVVEQMHEKRSYDLFFGRHIKYSAQAGLLQRKPAIIDVDDNEIEYYRLLINDPQTSLLRRFVLKRRVQTLESLLPKLLRDGPSLLVTKEEDLKLPGCETARVLPNIPYQLSLPNPPDPLPPNPGSKILIFVGMLSYVYNREGIKWFLDKVWTKVRQSERGVIFRIVGSRLGDEDRAAWAAIPGVEVVGFVNDLATIYRESAFVVVPVWSGGGTNIKILEAMMYGRTCVVTEPAYRGYGAYFEKGWMLEVARDADEFAEQCIKLLRYPDRCAFMGQMGAAALRKHFSFERFQNIVIDMVGSTVGSVLKTKAHTRTIIKH